MSHRSLAHIHPCMTAKAMAATRFDERDGIAGLQMARLADEILSKPDAELAALAAECPDLAWEWIDEFRRLKARADAESRMWSAAMTRLAKMLPDNVPVAAE